MHRLPILLTGATGAIGGRLLRRLEEESLPVRALARTPEKLAGRVAPTTEVVRGDLLEAESLDAALDGVSSAFYLVHSMSDDADFEEVDRRAARNFAAAAARAGVERIVYLGGLGVTDDDLSPHLRSRREVGEILRGSGVPVVELRASIVLGAGSLSFDMIRTLVERLPVMVTPRWVRVPAQPIALRDMVEYLRRSLEVPVDGHAIFEVGGPERVSYEEIMREYGRQRGLRRLMIPVPLLTPRLSSLWLALVTPHYARVGRALVDSIRHPTTLRDDRALHAFGIRPLGLSDAIAVALEEEDRDLAERLRREEISVGGSVAAGHRLVDRREIDVDAEPAEVFAPIRRIGGRTGWYFADTLWRLRGVVDRALGGSGMRLGRGRKEGLAVGQPLDFWRVEAYEPDHILRLRAEMKLPGRAWLEFEVFAHGKGTRLRQTAIFDPRGILGVLYWYAMAPAHNRIFAGMARGIVAAIGAAPRHRARLEGAPS